jgi:signal transduction histidine kinase
MFKRDNTAPGLTNVDINNVIHFVERIVYGDANLHSVAVQLDLSADIRPVKGDSVQLQQVMMNLMLNAFSAMSETDSDARRLVVRTRPVDDSNVLIEVEDNGIGIAEEKIEAIFSPFFTSNPEGLGMGLSICRSIIERHGGRISAASNPEGGAKFSIMLPVASK